MTVGAVAALVYIAVGAGPKALDAVEVRAERAVRVVEEMACVGKGVAPWIRRCATGAARGCWRIRRLGCGLWSSSGFRLRNRGCGRGCGRGSGRGGHIGSLYDTR